MNRNFVLQRDNSQDSSLKLLDFAPKPIPVSVLLFASQRFLQNSNAPFLLQIVPFAQDFLLKIFRELVFWHLWRITRFPSDGQPNVTGEPREFCERRSPTDCQATASSIEATEIRRSLYDDSLYPLSPLPFRQTLFRFSHQSLQLSTKFHEPALGLPV